MAYQFDTARDDRKGGLQLTWKDAEQNPNRRCSLNVSKNGKLSLIVFDKDQVYQLYESGGSPDQILQALRGMVL